MNDDVKCMNRRVFLGVTAGSVITLGLKSCVSSGGSDPEDARISFGVIADAQYCDKDPVGTRHYRASREKLSACVEELNREELAFTIHLGDFIDGDFGSFGELCPIYDRLQMPHYHLLGNHDFSVEEELKGDVPAALSLDARYYDFHFGKRRFIVLDGNDFSLYARPEGSTERARAAALLEDLKATGAPNAQPWNGAVGEEQLAWLEERLDVARLAGESVIVFCHFPVYPENVHNLWNDREVIAVLERSGVVEAYINGHNHAGDYGVKEGIHYLTMQGMVETADTTAFAVIHADRGQLEVDGRGRQAITVVRCQSKNVR
jgi:manganese-dependent ADP-ribose/CDP-alcohol diphosphatase